MTQLLDGIWLPLTGSFLTFMLCVISFFLSRLLGQFDQLTEQVGVLNETMKRIDKDLSGEVGILKERSSMLQQSVADIDPLWDRVRGVEQEVVAIKSGGCAVLERCKNG